MLPAFQPPGGVRSGQPLRCSGCWTGFVCAVQTEERGINQVLTKLVYLELGIRGRVCWLKGQP